MRRRRTAILGLAFVVGVVIGGGAALWLVPAWEARRLSRLFDGPQQACKAGPPRYAERVVYDLSAFGQESGGATLPGGPQVDRSGGWSPPGGPAVRRETEAGTQRRADVQAVTGASRAVRLRVPSVYRDRLPFETLAITAPSPGAVFPPNLCEPCVEWDDPQGALWQVRVGGGRGPDRWRFLATERRWWFPKSVWRQVAAAAVEEDAWVQVLGVRRDGRGARTGPVLASEPVRFRVAREPADEAVVYRLVTPPFWVLKTPDTFVRDLRSFDIRPFLLSRRKYCFNCHAFSSPTGTDGMLAVQSRYLPQDHDGLRVYFGVFDLATRQGWKARLPFEIQMTTYMAWSPDGRRLATSANQQVTVFPPIIHETQMAGEPTSDVAVYDLGRQEAFLLPGASDPQRLELFPRWTPDGKWIVFCSAPPAAHPEMVRYDLCVVPYNDGRGGEPQPIPGASANGRSNYFPRFSPDGRWFTFCQADGGDLMRSSSNIFIMGADLKGPARRLECNADHAADSWHSWSSNSRWLVFASKRDDGAFARLYLAHVDDQGRAAPAVALPLKQPPLQSFNIPEFLAKAPRIEERALFDALRVEGPAVSVKGP